MVLLGLAMAHSLFDTAVPLTILQEIETDADIPVLVRKMPKQLLKNPRHGIDEDCAEALYMTLKDSWLERWKLGVALGGPGTGVGVGVGAAADDRSIS